MVSTTNIGDICPPVNAYSASAGVSDQYHFVHTGKIVDLLRQDGWEFRTAFLRKPRKGGDPLHKRHCVRMVHGSESASPSDPHPEIVITNSHDGTSCLHVLAGIFRMVCSNGMTIAEETFGGFKLRHDNIKLRYLGDDWLHRRIQRVSEEVPTYVDACKQWAQIDMSRDQRFDFYRKAGELRGMDMAGYRYHQFERPLRREDDGQDLWTVFNRTQEKILQGGVTNYFDFDYDKKYTQRVLRPVTDVKKMEDINKELYNLAGNYAALN